MENKKIILFSLIFVALTTVFWGWRSTIFQVSASSFNNEITIENNYYDMRLAIIQI